MTSPSFITDLVGKRIVSINNPSAGDETIEIIAADTSGKQYRYCIYHSQDCCETVSIYTIIGVPAELVDRVIVSASETDDVPSDTSPAIEADVWGSHTWTCHRLETAVYRLTIYWLGTSNGYYSESVSIIREEL